MMKLSRRHLLGASVALLAAPALHAADAVWPEKPVRLIVPAPPASSLDVIARLLADRLKERWKQPVVVENKAGAGGMLGMDVVAKAAPDGHTLGIGFNGPVAFAPFLYRKMPYVPSRDLLPVVMTTSQPNVLAIPASVPARTWAEFVRWARLPDSRVNYASVGNGSSSHLAMELLRSQAGFEAVHVPYSGSPPAVASVATGETQALLAAAPALLPLVQAGRIRLIAVTGPQRLESLKDVPTLAEAGLPGVEALAWNGIFATAGTPAAVVQRINTDINALLQEPAVRNALTHQGLIVSGGSAAQFRSYIDSEAKRWGAVIQRLGITLD